MNWYQYDLNTQPASFDFLVWLSICYSHNDGKPFNVSITGNYKQYQIDVYGKEQTGQMFKNVVMESLNLFPVDRLSLFDGKSGIRLGHTAHQIRNMKKPLYSLVMDDNDIKMAKHQYGDDYILVVLRNCEWHPTRNSSDDWCEAAHALSFKKPVVIAPDLSSSTNPDWINNFTLARESSLKARAAIYQNAYCVLGVNGGAMSLAWHNTKCKYVTYKPIANAPSCDMNSYKARGFTEGSSWPWANVNQLYQWGDDTYDNIMAGYNRITDERGSGECFTAI